MWGSGMVGMIRLARLWLAILFFGGAAVAAEAKTDRVEQWVGSHTRLVWLQDHGNGADSLANGKSLMLYGYDSRDGRGERPLLSKVDNYFRPLFTPDGEQVIVSNRLTRRISLVDWQSGKVTDLGEGVAVAVWQETGRNLTPWKSNLWVYCFSGMQPENKYGTSQPLYRFRLDKPKKKELLWNNTNMAWDNVQLSRDGEVLGGLFPWPDGGVLWTKDKRWQRLGQGCWTSLSPDNSKLLWIFDGLHRNLQVHDIKGGRDWTVNINGAPEVGGFEVYHPRWSNHPRFFAVTGPYLKGEGGNRIGGGGEKVEIFLGRFNERVEKVEAWLKVTENSRADFYPEVWIDGGGKAELTTVESKKQVAQPTKELSADRAGRIFVWENMKAANQLPEKSPIGFFQCNIDLRGRALFSKNLRLNTAGGFGETGEVGKKMGAVLKKSGKLGLELVYHAEVEQLGAIASFGSGAANVVQLRQQSSDVQLVGQAANATWPKALTPGRTQHLALNLGNGKAELFVNGVSVGTKDARVDFAASAVDSFALGDREGKLRAQLAAIAVYDRALLKGEIDASSRLAQGLGGEAADKPLVLEGTLLERTEIPAPDAIGAYSRALVVNTYKVDRVVQGEYSHERLLVAEWAILDRTVIKAYQEPTVSEQLVVEPFSRHPQLEGERQMMDVFEPDLEMYYRLP
jgi:Concanavalin A-like lectin/glucanases superfamily